MWELTFHVYVADPKLLHDETLNIMLAGRDTVSVTPMTSK